MKTTFHLVMGLFLLSLLTVSCNDDDTSDIPKEQSNIVALAQKTDNLSSLVAALAKVDEKSDIDLIGTLSGNGPFTVFAPTNAAFSNLLNSLDGFATLDDFDTDEEKDLLASILSYHVVSGSAFSTDLSNGSTLTTVQGETLGVSINGDVKINDSGTSPATVVQADIGASNGVVHIIDKVLVPQAAIDAINEMGKSNLVEVVVGADNLTLLEAAVIKADLVDTLSGEGPFTVFAPTDDAFVALLDALGDGYNSLDDFDTEEEIALLTDILLYHVVPANVMSSDLSPGMVATALTDNSLTVIASGDTYVIGDASGTNANITAVDIEASNGVAHTIDKVLLHQAAVDFANSL